MATTEPETPIRFCYQGLGKNRARAITKKVWCERVRFRADGGFRDCDLPQRHAKNLRRTRALGCGADATTRATGDDV